MAYLVTGGSKHVTATRRRLTASGLSLALLAAACTSSDSGSEGVAPPTSAQLDGAETSTVPDVTSTLDPATFDVVVPDPDPTLLPLDAAVRVGVLDNGLTYYLRSNQAPGQKLSLRLVVNAGAAMQDQPDAGLAHFVEHMLFNGTENYPGSTVDEVLQRLGLEFGADLNAYTSVDETVYELTSSIAPAAVTEAFDVMADWAMAATLNEQAVIDERGVVREERRVRTESGAGQSYVLFDDIYTTNSDYSGFFTIGSVEGIMETTSQDARRFYDRWYRPDLMAVVVVGDLTLDQMEAEVQSRFGAVTDRGDGQERAEPATEPLNEQVIERYVHPEMSRPAVSLDFWIPSWDAGTVGGERLEMLEDVLSVVIQNRLSEGVERGEIRALQPYAGGFSYNRQSSFLGFNFTGADLTHATEDVLASLASLEADGATEDEVGRAVEAIQASVDQFRDTSDTRQDSFFADSYVAHFLSGAEASEIDVWHTRASNNLSAFDAADVTDHFRYLMSVSAPLVVGLGPDESSVPTVDELEAAVAAGLAKGDAGLVLTEIEELDQLMDRPEPAEEVEILRLRELGASILRFENGVTGIFMHSDIEEEAVSILASSSGGWSTLEPGDGALVGLVTSAVGGSGVAGFGKVQLDRYLADVVVSMRPYIEENEEGFYGSAASQDAEVMFQLLNLLVTAPQIDDVAFAGAVQTARVNAQNAQIDPSTLSFSALSSARYDNDPYQDLVATEANIDAMTAEAALVMYNKRLGKVDDLVVVLVGDLPSAEALELLRSYVGTLPAGDADRFEDRWVEPPASVVEIEVSAGDDGSGAGVDFQFTGVRPVDDESLLVTDLVGRILEARLLDAVREDLGATYGAQIYPIGFSEPDELIETYIIVNGDPARLDVIEDVVLAEIQDLVVNGPSEDELQRAIAVSVEDYRFVNNFQLIQMMHTVAGEANPNPFTRSEAHAAVQNISSAQIRSMAADMFPSDRWIRVQRSE